MAESVLSDFIPQVRPKLGGRTDIDDRISQWLLEAYRELTMGYDFETMEKSTQDLTVPGTDIYAYPTDARALKAITLVDATVASASPIQPKKKNIQVVRRYQVGIQGAPAVWAPFSSSYILRPVPDLSYTIYLDYWKKPTVDLTSISTINSTAIELPDDWLDILVYLATEKGHAELQETDKAQAVHQLVHGDPNPSKGFPGMIREHTNRNAKENGISDYGLRPRIRRYTSGR